MRYPLLVLGFSLIVLILFSGCITPQSQGSDVQLTHQPDPSRTGLEIGDTAIFEFKGFKKSVRVTGFNETSGIMYLETQNIGDKAIAIKSRAWIVDGNGVHYDLPELPDEGISHGEPRPGLFTLYQFPDLKNSTKKGKITFHYGFGNQEASWIITG
jgi:hypothetical protein